MLLSSSSWKWFFSSLKIASERTIFCLTWCCCSRYCLISSLACRTESANPSMINTFGFFWRAKIISFDFSNSRRLGGHFLLVLMNSLSVSSSSRRSVMMILVSSLWIAQYLSAVTIFHLPRCFLTCTLWRIEYYRNKSRVVLLFQCYRKICDHGLLL